MCSTCASNRKWRVINILCWQRGLAIITSLRYVARAVINCRLIGNNWLPYIFSTLDPTDPSFMAVFLTFWPGKRQCLHATRDASCMHKCGLRCRNVRMSFVRLSVMSTQLSVSSKFYDHPIVYPQQCSFLWLIGSALQNSDGMPPLNTTWRIEIWAFCHAVRFVRLT